MLAEKQRRSLYPSSAGMADDLCDQFDNMAGFLRSDHLDTFPGIDRTVVSFLSMEASYPACLQARQNFDDRT